MLKNNFKQNILRDNFTLKLLKNLRNWLVTCTPKPKVPGSCRAVSCVERWALWSNRPANLWASVKQVEVVERSEKDSLPFPCCHVNRECSPLYLFIIPRYFSLENTSWIFLHCLFQSFRSMVTDKKKTFCDNETEHVLRTVTFDGILWYVIKINIK